MMILFSFELWFQRVAGYESPLTFGYCPNWGDPLPKFILTLFLHNFPPKIEGFAQFPTAKEKMHFSAEKIGDSPKSETNWALICSTIKSSINWIYTIYGIIHHNNMEFRVFASANTRSFFFRFWSTHWFAFLSSTGETMWSWWLKDPKLSSC